MTAPTTKPKNDGRETRLALVDLEIRAAEEGKRKTLVGYACVFNATADIGGYWIERFAPGAFKDSLGERDVLALYSHDRARVIGRSGAGTLRLEEDGKGLRVEIDLPDTSDGRDVEVLVERGDVAGMSMGFVTRKEAWDETTEPPNRTIEKCDLYEVSVLPDPAYPDTEVGLRSLEHARQEKRQHNKTGFAYRRGRQAHAERGI